MSPHVNRRIRVLVSHAEPLVRLGLLNALTQHEDIEAWAATEGGWFDEVVAADVVVLDLPTALERRPPPTAAWQSRLPGPRVLVVTHQDREQDVKMALSRSVHGYLLIDSPLPEVVNGVRALARGERYLAPPIARRMAEGLAHEPLTPREVEVLRRLTLGCSNKVIANELTIAVGTVKVHVKAILSKLEADCRTHAASIAVQRGLCDHGDRQRRQPPSRPWAPTAGPAMAHRMPSQRGQSGC